MRHVQQQGAGSVGIVGGVHAGQPVDQVVFGQQDFGDAGKQVRLVLAHPQQLGRGKAGKSDVAGPGAELVIADGLVQVVHLGGGAAVVPQNGRVQHIAGGVQRHQAVHLAAHADARHLLCIKAGQQLRHASQAGLPPVGGVLLAPAGAGEGERIFFGHSVQHPADLVHQQEFAGRGPQVDADIQHGLTSITFCRFLYLFYL